MQFSRSDSDASTLRGSEREDVAILIFEARKRAKPNKPMGGRYSYGVRWRKNGGLESTGLTHGERSLDHGLADTVLLKYDSRNSREVLTALCSEVRKAGLYASLGSGYTVPWQERVWFER